MMQRLVFFALVCAALLSACEDERLAHEQADALIDEMYCADNPHEPVCAHEKPGSAAPPSGGAFPFPLH